MSLPEKTNPLQISNNDSFSLSSSSFRITEICRAIYKRKWHMVVNLLNSKNEKYAIQVKVRDRCGRTPLHIACHRNPPIYLVQQLYNAYPDAATIQSNDGSTPLHLACVFASDDVVDFLLHKAPKATLIKSCREFREGGDKEWFPLHHACCTDNISSKNIFYLLEKDMTPLFVKDSYGDTILSSFFKKWNRPLREQVDAYTYAMIPFAYPFITRFYLLTSLFEVYGSASILLKSFIDGNIYQESFQMVHATLKVQFCPWVFFHIALQRNPSEVFQVDGNGLLPIHIAAKMPMFSDGEMYQCTVCRNRPNESPRYNQKVGSDILCTKCMARYKGDEADYHLQYPVKKYGAAISDLITFFPQSTCIPDNEGRLPLNLAIENGKRWNDGVRDIYQAAPYEIIMTRDVKTHMYPFMIAAALSCDKKADEKSHDNSKSVNQRLSSQMTLSYLLLLEDPSVVQIGILD